VIEMISHVVVYVRCEVNTISFFSRRILSNVWNTF
jgi:hypothetical protein